MTKVKVNSKIMHSQHIRKRRLLEALESYTKPDEKKLWKSLKCSKVQKEQLRKVDKKLKVFEKWEIIKRRNIEKLVKAVEALQDLEEKVDEKEEKLSAVGIEIDEEDFAEFCRKTPFKIQPSLQQDPLEQLRKATLASLSSKSTPVKTVKKTKITSASPLITTKASKKYIMKKFIENEDGMVVIGPNGTAISKAALNAINWALAGPAFTRKVLMEVFDRETLAFHSLTGKPSPAFLDCDKPLKNQLDPAKVADIIHFVTEHTSMSPKEVRNAITTKCADENKMHRQRVKKRLMPAQQNKI